MSAPRGHVAPDQGERDKRRDHRDSDHGEERPGAPYSIAQLPM